MTLAVEHPVTSIVSAVIYIDVFAGTSFRTQYQYVVNSCTVHSCAFARTVLIAVNEARIRCASYCFALAWRGPIAAIDSLCRTSH